MRKCLGNETNCCSAAHASAHAFRCAGAAFALLAACGLGASSLVEGVFHRRFQQLMRLFLDELGVLQTHNQIQLFLLHALHLVLVEGLLVCLALQLVLDLRAGAVLLFDELVLAL